MNFNEIDLLVTLSPKTKGRPAAKLKLLKERVSGTYQLTDPKFQSLMKDLDAPVAARNTDYVLSPVCDHYYEKGHEDLQEILTNFHMDTGDSTYRTANRLCFEVFAYALRTGLSNIFTGTATTLVIGVHNLDTLLSEIEDNGKRADVDDSRVSMLAWDVDSFSLIEDEWPDFSDASSKANDEAHVTIAENAKYFASHTTMCNNGGVIGKRLGKFMIFMYSISHPKYDGQIRDLSDHDVAYVKSMLYRQEAQAAKS